MPIFVLHKHYATHIHWDLRLEVNGVLKSWAIPKEPPKKKNIKRLAIQVEDHPLSYAKFEGEIKEGYGKGKVEIWDSGKFHIIDEKKDKLIFELNGKKMKGEYVLLRFTGNKKNWLLFKK